MASTEDVITVVVATVIIGLTTIVCSFVGTLVAQKLSRSKNRSDCDEELAKLIQNEVDRSFLTWDL